MLYNLVDAQGILAVVNTETSSSTPGHASFLFSPLNNKKGSWSYKLFVIASKDTWLHYTLVARVTELEGSLQNAVKRYKVTCNSFKEKDRQMEDHRKDA